MNMISKILLGALVLAVAACVWYLLTRKNSGGCDRNCAGCTQSCTDRKKDE